MHILLTRPLEDSQEHILRLQQHGHKISHMPVIKIEKKSYENLNFSNYKGIIFTSSNSIKFLDVKLVDKKINHKLTNTYVMAERQFLKILEGDCETAVGAIANIEGNNITLEAELFSIDGKQRFYHSASKDINFAFELGTEVGEILKKESNNSYKR